MSRVAVEDPSLACPDGCHAIDPLPGVPFERSYVSGEPRGQRVRIAYYRRDDDGAIVAPCWFGPGCEGPPGHAHGGSLAAVLDEVMGVAAWNAGHAVVLARLVTENRAMLPLRVPVTATARVERVEGRKVTVRASIHDGDGSPFVESEGLFVTIGLERFQEMFRQARQSTG